MEEDEELRELFGGNEAGPTADTELGDYPSGPWGWMATEHRHRLAQASLRAKHEQEDRPGARQRSQRRGARRT